jgi:hypothetical protein
LSSLIQINRNPTTVQEINIFITFYILKQPCHWIISMFTATYEYFGITRKIIKIIFSAKQLFG